MPQLIQIRRAAAATPGPLPVVGPNGEMAYARGGFTNLPVHVVGSNDLIMSDGAAFNTLIGPTRQVELVGNQTINGVKTFAVDVNLNITPTQPLHGANKAYVDQAVAAGVVTSDELTITGTGDTAAPITLRGAAIFNAAGSGLNFAAGVTNVLQATQAVFGGAAMATDAEIITGTDDTLIITPRGLRTQNGLDAAALTTVAKTIVPAINEVWTHLLTISGIMILVGSYDAAADMVSPGTGGFIVAGPLPAASAANNGHYLIVNNSGTGTGNAPAVPMINGDWLYSDGTAWNQLSIAQPLQDASNVAVVPPVLGANNVQDALEALAIQTVLVDGISIVGDGIATMLEVAVVDGGTW